MRGELECLHSAELSPEAFSPSQRLEIDLTPLLSLGIKLGRPHPAVLRRALLGIDGSFPAYDLTGVNLSDVEELVNWSWELFHAESNLAQGTPPIAEDRYKDSLNEPSKLSKV